MKGNYRLKWITIEMRYTSIKKLLTGDWSLVKNKSTVIIKFLSSNSLTYQRNEIPE